MKNTPSSKLMTVVLEAPSSKTVEGSALPKKSKDWGSQPSGGIPDLCSELFLLIPKLAKC